MANKLELTWVGKEKEIKVEPRILIENPQLSNMGKVSAKLGQASFFDEPTSDNFDNMLIHGDNLLALKALEAKYAGKIKCIYIDPPYNTGYAFEQYDDNLEHSIWLGLMRPRLEIMRNLLSDDGSIWISIDDDEQAYLKVLCDEVFGRKNFVNNVIWEKKFSPQNAAKWLSDSHDFIMVYAKKKETWTVNLLPRSDEMNARYKNPDNDPRGVWISDNLLRKDVQKSGLYTITTPNGTKHDPQKGRSWRVSEEKFLEMVKDNRIWFGEDGGNVPRIKRFLSEVQDGMRPMTIWKWTEVGHNQEASQENRKIMGEVEPFATPKPERLIERILTLATNEGDLVLDSFLGSGTTAAVAHKMGRKWIGIEMGDHAYTHCKVRMDKVIEGEQGGISKARNWQGGGGYKFYELAPSLVVEDKFGMPIINKEYNADMLSAAMALHEGYSYEPDENCFWKQGKNENSYIFTTTQHVTESFLEMISKEMQEEESLIVACKSYEQGVDKLFKNIFVKKIPKVLLDKCQFGVENYNLNIIDIPEIDEDEE